MVWGRVPQSSAALLFTDSFFMWNKELKRKISFPCCVLLYKAKALENGESIISVANINTVSSAIFALLCASKQIVQKDL